MAGLLDILGSDTGLLGLQLMAAGSAKPVRTGFGEGLLSSLQAVQAQRAAEEDRKARQQMQAMQMQQMQEAAAARKQAQEQQQLDQGLLRQSFAPLAGPTPDGSPLMPNRLDPRFMIGQGASMGGVQQAMQLDQALNPQVNQPKLKSVEPMRGTDGRMVNVALFDDGSHKVLPYGVKPEIALQQLGDRVMAIDKNDTTGGASFRVGIDPGSQLSANVAMRGQNMADARAREGNQISATNGKIPPGYRMRADGNLEAIPGGPADIKAGELGAKTEQRRQMGIEGANSVLGIVGDAKELVGMSTTGLGGALKVIPATNARNLSAKLETIKANLGFDRLQQMRESSPTGGALGALAVQELTALQATVASLDQMQSPAQLRGALDKIDKHYRGWLRTMGGSSNTAKPTVTRTGTDASGRKVQQMSDGSIQYAD